MPKLLLIHGFEGSSQGNWFPWLEKEAEGMGFEVINVDLPDPDHPDEQKVLPFLEEIVKNFSNDDYIVGHSLGGYWACRIAQNKQFGKIILVAPAVGDLSFEKARREWKGSDIDALERTTLKPVDVNTVRASEKVVFYSKNDPYISYQNISMFNEQWKCILLDTKGHFQQKNFPEIISEFIEAYVP